MSEEKQRAEAVAFAKDVAKSDSLVTPKVDYYQYIKGQGWARKRWGALMRAGHACQVCKSTTNLQIHHNSYANLGHEPAADLICLCSECHSLFHRNRHLAPVPSEVRS